MLLLKNLACTAALTVGVFCWGATAFSTPNKSKGAASSGTPVHRTVIHSEAYKKRAHLGEHLNFKITPIFFPG